MALSDSIAGLARPEHRFFDEAGALIFVDKAHLSASCYFEHVENHAWTSAAEVLLPEGWRVMPAIQHRDGSWAVSLINDERDGVVTGKGAALSCAMVVAALKVRGL